ncbi:MAG: amylo-alpha-1,6-glucosidase [Candidatus Dormibacteraeota bacterium]|nr:amylo-alpha-1,6-glucosidase [Candidatus Dormibacteraeota bacterium]
MTVPGADHENDLNSVFTLTTKAGTVFALCAPNGDIDTSGNSAHGLYFHDMRYLDRATLRVNGDAMSVLLASADRSDRSISVLTNPPLQLAGWALPEQRLSVRRERRLGEVMIEQVTIENFALRALRVILDFEFASSFDDIFVVRGSPRGKRGTLQEPRWEGSSLILAYEGADGRRRRLSLAFDPPPTRTNASGATYELNLNAHGASTIQVKGALSDIGGGSLEAGPTKPPTKYLDRATIETDNQLFNRVIKRCFDDLGMLLTRQRGDTFFAAGVPWFVALFGRDSLITALETLPYDPRIAANTLKRLAKRQGRRHDPRTLEEPGRIMHELRVGEMANLREVPYTPYYGTVDATPLFVVLLGEYIRWTGDRGLWRRLKGNVIRALDWIDQCGGHGLGFTSYDTDTNLGWKDSGNCIVRPDGSRAKPPIALVEVQGYVYWAKRLAASLFELDNDLETSSRLTREGEKLRRDFNRKFWLRRSGYLALALERGGRQVESVTSNPGQALLSGIVSPRHVAAVSRMLMSGELFSGWGVRTLAEDEVAYNPIDYQVGSVWPHDNALIAAGLKRTGRAKEALRIFTAVFEAAALFPQNRLPEVFAGFGRSQYPVPVRYPVACSPQAWAAGALPYMLTAMLGLEPDAVRQVLKVSNPSLPDWLSEVTLRNLRVGEATVDLCCQHHDGTTQVTVARQRGKLAVLVGQEAAKG